MERLRNCEDKIGIINDIYSGKRLEMGVIVAQDMERNERESLVFFFFSVFSVVVNVPKFDSLTVVHPLPSFLPLPGSY